jgi:hypothetical protein
VGAVKQPGEITMNQPDNIPECAAVLRRRLDIINEHMKDAAKLMEEGCDIDVPDIINECIELSKREGK